MVGIGHILGRGLGPELVRTPVGGVSREMRRFHRDLGAGYDKVSHIERELRHQHPEWIEDRYRDDGRKRQRHRGGDRDAQHPHHPAVARGNGKARL